MLGQFFGAKIVNVYKYPSELSHIAFYDYFFCICFGFSRVDNLFAAAAAESLQLCPTPCDPIDGSPPGFLSLGFSRQEYWSGLPFPSLMHESEK